MNKQPIGIFDSGYGGLTVLKEITTRLPQYDFIYLGDNARAPYGTRSYDTVYHYTLECIQWFFEQGCPLVILACNTASAKALRTIQQNDLPKIDASKRILGVIRPTAEIIGKFTKTGNVGILATPGTISSNSYPLEIQKFYPRLKIYQEACPMWVPLVENNEYDSPGADFFINKNIAHLLKQSSSIDTILLACTHYPLLINKIKAVVPADKIILSQGKIVADSLQQYLISHSEMDEKCSKNGKYNFYTTDSTEDFDNHATAFFGRRMQSKFLQL